MALTGSYFEFEETLSPTLSQSVLIHYPIELPVDDVNYLKRGTSENIWVSESVETINEIEGAYVAIKASSIQYSVANAEDKHHYLTVVYNVYDSENEKNENYFSPASSSDLSMMSITLDQTTGSENLINLGYDLMKNNRSFISMSNC